MTDPIVSPGWLAARLGDVDILDATYFLPADPDRARAEFAEAHVPGARLFEIDEIADKPHHLAHMMPDEATFAAAMAELGIDGSLPVVVYDRSANHFSAPRVWFTLRAFGMQETYVLDGGLAGWCAAGHPLEAGPAQTPAVPPRAWTLDRSKVLSAGEVAEAARQGEPILDARSAERFAGTAPEPRPGLRSGHMPGSICVPFTALTGDDGRFRDTEDLRRMFGPPQEAMPVVSCGSGMTACGLALGLARLGREARLYDASWAEWGTGTVGEIRSGPEAPL